MKWNRKLYIGNKAKKDKNKLIKIIKRNKFSPLLYIIFLENREIQTLHNSIFNLCLKQDGDDKLILGFAVGKFEALGLMADIVDEVYKKTGGFDYETYFKS